MPQIKRAYIDTGKVRYIFRPFVGDLNRFPADRLAAEALYCAGEQDPDKFWEMHEWLFSHAEDWLYADDVVAALVVSPTAELDLDGDALEQCLREERYRDKIQSILDGARARGINSTPTFQINDRPLLIGARPFEEFRQIIEEELAR